MPSSQLRSISNISVSSLFGMYDYALDLGADGKSDEDKISILYGDNGSGKSTLLKLAFHMLASNPKSGHKTFLLNTEFEKLIVTFNDGSIVQAIRKKNQTSGPYVMSIKRPGKRMQSGAVETPKIDEGVDFHKKVLPALQDLDCTLYLLSDDRAIHRAGGSAEDRMRVRKRRHYREEITIMEMELDRHSLERAETPEDISKQLLKDAITQTEEWFRRRVLGGSTKGDSGVNEIYAKILKRISDAGGRKDTGPTKKSVEKRINRLVADSENFAKYGLLPIFNGTDILDVLSAANKSTYDVVVDVLTPYLDSMETKNEAMQNIFNRIDTFVTVAGQFYTNKTLSFDLRRGINIQSSDGRTLDPEMLSSGERHLLLLFCTSIVTSGSPSILMIDEPEISLNIKWQRLLIDSLIQCIGDNDIQFIFSTHSLEILAKHKPRVVKLENIRR